MMLDLQKAETDVLFLTDIALTGAGFGYVASASGGNEEIFVPRSIVMACDMKVGQRYTIKRAENYPGRREEVPWRVIWAEPNAASDVSPTPLRDGPTDEETVLMESAIALLEDNGPWKVAEIAEHLGQTVHVTRNAMLWLFRTGRVSKATIYAPAQQVPLETLYSIAPEDLDPSVYWATDDG